MKKDRIILGTVFLAALILYGFTTADFAAFLIAVIVIYFCVAKVITSVSGKNLKCALSQGTECGKGESAEIHFTIKNESIVPVFFCTVFITAENRLTGTAEKLEKRVSLLPRREKTFDFSLTDYCCGYIRISITELCIADPLNIFMKHREAEGKTETEHLVLPVIAELPLKKDELDRYDMESYRYSQKRKGDDSSETFGIKAYVPGDNIKAIHWKLSSKMDDVVIREYGLPVDNNVLVLGDKRENDIMIPEMKSEVTELFLSVLYTLAKQGLHHDAGWYDYNLQEFQCRKILTTDDVYGIIPYLLSGPFREDRMSSPDHYMESDTDTDYGSYIYITWGNSDKNSETERLRNYGEVDIYRPENFR